MSLLVTKDFTTMGGISLDQLYVRFSFIMNFSGKNVDVNIQNYISRDAYLEQIHQNIIPIIEVPTTLNFDYDRDIDGVDLLTAVHNKVRGYLSSDRPTSIALLDPSTGKKQYDPSTGELITQVIPKFAEEGEITFVDIEDPSIG